ncbi:hypothetical protein A8C75_18790 [Marinobacterium aestuarii]|uniref:Uncharacterized protein n=1 Tax=Marinobacterium aestuarii TaxID=1821621 RepID=A0A1A9F3H5_9GAMM|nr:hypothetical protein [Marinobacterium aestuarii]ANG64319.1 hypothetical protein A8C75_18790 [Marinobacterium aestuarii]
MMRPSPLPPRLIAVTLLAALLFTPPLLGLFDQAGDSGLSWLPLYLFGAWAFVILLAALTLELSDDD